MGCFCFTIVVDYAAHGFVRCWWCCVPRRWDVRVLLAARNDDGRVMLVEALETNLETNGYARCGTFVCRDVTQFTMCTMLLQKHHIAGLFPILRYALNNTIKPTHPPSSRGNITNRHSDTTPLQRIWLLPSWHIIAITVYVYHHTSRERGAPLSFLVSYPHRS